MSDLAIEALGTVLTLACGVAALWQPLARARRQLERLVTKLDGRVEHLEQEQERLRLSVREHYQEFDRLRLSLARIEAALMVRGTQNPPDGVPRR